MRGKHVREGHGQGVQHEEFSMRGEYVREGYCQGILA